MQVHLLCSDVDLGLCCRFVEAPIRFRTATAAPRCLRPPPRDRPVRVAELCNSNADALFDALRFCHEHGIRGFRVTSQILPLCSLPRVGYKPTALSQLQARSPPVPRVRRLCPGLSDSARFHPDLVAASIRELDYQTRVAKWIGADVINIPAGGVYGDKPQASPKSLTDCRRAFEVRVEVGKALARPFTLTS